MIYAWSIKNIRKLTFQVVISCYFIVIYSSFSFSFLTTDSFHLQFHHCYWKRSLRNLISQLNSLVTWQSKQGQERVKSLQFILWMKFQWNSSWNSQIIILYLQWLWNAVKESAFLQSCGDSGCCSWLNFCLSRLA